MTIPRQRSPARNQAAVCFQVGQGITVDLKTVREYRGIPAPSPAGRTGILADEAAILQVYCCAQFGGGISRPTSADIHQANQQAIRIMRQGLLQRVQKRRQRRILRAECPAPWILRKTGLASVFSEFPDTV